LAEQPLRRLAEISRELGIDRHTVTRALREHCACSFRQLQEAFIRSKCLAYGGPTDRPRLVKEISGSVGYVRADSLARWLRRADVRQATGEEPVRAEERDRRCSSCMTETPPARTRR